MNSFKVFVDEIERKNKKVNKIFTVQCKFRVHNCVINFQNHNRSSIKNSKSQLIDYLTPELCSKLGKCIDLKSINALQSNNNIDIEVVSGNATENDDGNECESQYDDNVH